jgi:hypothetical protein
MTTPGPDIRAMLDETGREFDRARQAYLDGDVNGAANLLYDFLWSVRQVRERMLDEHHSSLSANMRATP